MQLRRKNATTPPGQSDEGRLGPVRPHRHDPDERPSREDRDYGSTIFTRPVVPLPRFLRGRKKPPG
jgi:hypothetical protein